MNPVIEVSHRRRSVLNIIARTVLVFIVLSAVCVFATLYYLQKPHGNFPRNSGTVIEPGSSVSNIVEQFETEHYVRSSTLLQAILAFSFDVTAIQAGTYTFTEPLSVWKFAEHITSTGPSEPLVSITFPEGMTVKDFAGIAEAKLPNFVVDSFLSYANDFEGKLFPETYFVPDRFTDEAVFDLLRKTYSEKISALEKDISEHSLSEYEILVLASIIEREANTAESMRLVSSVLQNRIAIGMPLQADASIEYVLNKPLSELTPQDLKIDSPYNTYLNVELPPTPIGNPGIDSITAVLQPTESDYFYYITDEEGVFHFAETFAEHNRNIARYLR